MTKSQHIFFPASSSGGGSISLFYCSFFGGEEGVEGEKKIIAGYKKERKLNRSTFFCLFGVPTVV